MRGRTERRCALTRFRLLGFVIRHLVDTVSVLPMHARAAASRAPPILYAFRRCKSAAPQRMAANKGSASASMHWEGPRVTLA
jgi:hypothetical protein